MMKSTDEMKVVGDRIHKVMMELIRDVRSQDEWDGSYDTLMDSISDDFVIVYLGERSEFKEDSDK